MPESRLLANEKIVRGLAADPVLGDFVEVFPNLLQGRERSIKQSFTRMAKLVGNAHRSASIQFTIDDGKEVRYWSLLLTPKGSQVLEDRIENPDLEIITSEEVWSQIATGQLSPMEAFGQGNMRVIGEITLARFLARKLQGKENI